MCPTETLSYSARALANVVISCSNFNNADQRYINYSKLLCNDHLPWRLATTFSATDNTHCLSDLLNLSSQMQPAK